MIVDPSLPLRLGGSPNCGRTPPSFAFAAICDTNGIGLRVYKSFSPEIIGGFPEFSFGGNWQKPPSVAHSRARCRSSAFRPLESPSFHSRWGITASGSDQLSQSVVKNPRLNTTSQTGEIFRSISRTSIPSPRSVSAFIRERSPCK